MARNGRVKVERVKRRRDSDLAVVEDRVPDMFGDDVMKKSEDVTL